MSNGSGWFAVDKDGLRKLIEKRGIAHIISELIQNAWDTEATDVDVTITPVPGKPLVEVVVTDNDPRGFSDLAHAFTLFAESEKKGNPQKRGRFCLGEKLFLALCERAEIKSTKGTVVFDASGERSSSRARTQRGSIVSATMRLTRDQLAEVERGILRLLPPAGVVTRFNGEVLQHRPVVRTFKAPGLMTDLADDDGYLVRRHRDCTVDMIAPMGDERPMLYEMGIPVVEFDGGERYHLNVGQKVPLNQQRDNVPYAFLAALRVAMLNDTHDLLTAEDATQTWARQAAGDGRCTSAAIATSITQRFGTKVVSRDVNDPEANGRATAAGFVVLPGGSLSGGEWENAKKAGIILPAGKVTPGPKALADGFEGGEPLRMVDPAKWPEGMTRIVTLASRLGRELLNEQVTVNVASDVRMLAAAMYGASSRTLTFNLLRLGHAWFQQEPDAEPVLSIIIHELAHHYAGDHLTDGFHESCCNLGARTARLMRYPSVFEV